MPSGLANKEKQRVRQLFAEGKVGKEELLAAEAASYHGAGTCTFYGTANSNQMMMELMGLHIPGAAFVNPGTPLRQALTRAAVHRVAALASDEGAAAGRRSSTSGRSSTPRWGCWRRADRPIMRSTFPRLPGRRGSSSTGRIWTSCRAAVPLIARVYPNGSGDVNDFHHAGGMAFTTHTLLEAGLLHGDILTAGADDFSAYADQRRGSRARSWHGTRSRKAATPTCFALQANHSLPTAECGWSSGNLGRAIFKTSAVAPERWTTEAPCRIFSDQDQVLAAFQAGELDRDVVVVVRFQGPRANGMPELHKLTPPLGVLQDKGFKVALVTDGRMSGASGKVPAAIHCCPEALCDGPLARLRDGDVIRLCGHDGGARSARRRPRRAASRPRRRRRRSAPGANCSPSCGRPPTMPSMADRRCSTRWKRWHDHRRGHAAGAGHSGADD